MTRRVRRNNTLIATVPGDVPLEWSPPNIPIGESPLDNLDRAMIPEAERFDLVAGRTRRRHRQPRDRHWEGGIVGGDQSRRGAGGDL